MVSIDE
jgi:hypothetical protein